MKVAELRPCSKCGGLLTPVSTCATCGIVALRSELSDVEARVDCPQCKASNPTAFACDRCSTRYRFEDVTGTREPPSACPQCGTFVDPGVSPCPTCGAVLTEAKRESTPPVKARPLRRIRGEYGEEDLKEISRIPGVDRSHAETLCRAGFNALWKIRGAPEEQLAAIPEIGAPVAKTIKDSIRFILLLPPRRSREDVLEEELACPRCACVTSHFARKCPDCGVEFDEEEFDPELREEIEREPDRSLLAFYDMRLREAESDADIWYARACLLLGMRQQREALASIDTALRLSNGAQRVLQARSRILEGMKEVQPAAEEPKDTTQTTPSEPDQASMSQDEFREAIEAFDSLLGLRERECSVCGARILGDATWCPDCRTMLEKRPAAAGRAPEITALEELERIAEEPRPEPSTVQEPSEAPSRKVTRRAPPSGPSLGRVSQDLHTRRGLVNGHGLVNGRGRVNGLINGNGFVNGSIVSGHRLPARVTTMRYALVAVALLVGSIFVGILLSPPAAPASAIIVDGRAGEWASVPTYADRVAGPDPNASIERYGVFLEGDSLYVLIEVSGRALGDASGYDAFYVFLDTDGKPTTGYEIEGLGADYAAEVYGGAGVVASARLYEFPQDAEINWSRRTAIAGIPAAVSSSTLELRIDLRDFPSFSSENSTILVAADDFEGAFHRASVAITSVPGAIRVSQRPLVSILPAGTSAALELDVTAVGGLREGDTWPVGPFSFDATAGVTMATSPTTVVLSQTSPQATVVVDVTATMLPVGTPVEVSLSGVTASRPVTVTGEGLRAYFGAVSPGIRIDGLFADWTSLRVGDGADTTPVRPSLDIDTFGASADPLGAYFYLQAVATLHGGIGAPQRFVPIPQTPGGSGSATPGPPLPRITGEETARVYVDANSTAPRGVLVGGIYADYMVEVRGFAGRITQRTVFDWQNGWVPNSSLTLQVAKNATALEGSLAIPPAERNATLMVFETNDWTGRGDVTVILTTRGVSMDRTRDAPRLELLGSPPGAQYLSTKPLSGALTADGACDDPGYADAGTFVHANMSIKAGRTADFVWICIEASLDTTDDGGSDSATIHFDRDDSGGLPSAADRRFRLDGASSTLTPEIGNDVGVWVPCATSGTPAWNECHADNAATSSFDATQRYEFKVHYLDVWNTTAPEAGTRAGFAILIFDGSDGATYRWGNADEEVGGQSLDTWGHLGLPEFEEIAVPVVGLVALVLFWRRRRQIT